jgi:hypothetical protein
MLVACRLAGLSRLRRTMQGSERERNRWGLRGNFAHPKRCQPLSPVRWRAAYELMG